MLALNGELKITWKRQWLI